MPRPTLLRTTLASASAVLLIALTAAAQPTQTPNPAAAEGDAALQKGATLFVETGCVACHSVDGRRMVGPSIKGLFGSTRALTTGQKVAVDDAYLRAALTDPMKHVPVGFPPAMPNYGGQLSPADLDALVAYMKRFGAPAKADAAPAKADAAPKGR